MLVMKKKPKIKYDPSLLDKFTEEEWDGLKQLLDSLDPKTLIENSCVVEALPPNNMNCPHCHSDLLPTEAGWKDKNGDAIQVFYCESCDKDFWGNKLN